MRRSIRSRPYFSPTLLTFSLSLLAFTTSAPAQDVEPEEMICRDMGDIFCALDEISEGVKAVETPAIVGPVPSERQKSKMSHSVIDLQRARTDSVLATNGEKDLPAKVELINLNSEINIWYLLKLSRTAGSPEWYHIENATGQPLSLAPDFREGLLLTGNGGQERCVLWTGGKGSMLAKSRLANAPYVQLCKAPLYLRNRIDGYKTTKEWVVEFLRSSVTGGETITTIVKETVYKDNFLIKSDGSKIATGKDYPDAPEAAVIDAKFKGEGINAREMGLGLDIGPADALEAGRWYRSARQAGVFVSAIEPKAIDTAILSSHKDYVKGLDNVELGAAAYLVAFDLGAFDVNFAVGTDHPAVGWSERVLPEVKDPAVKGPDGFDSITPLTPTGLIPPYLTSRLAGIFTGGFKRDHGAFRWGELARQNSGTHYGFVENGVVLSELQPELATLLVYKDGQVDFKTWKKADNETVSRVRFARQNGVPIIDWDPVQKKGVPGRYVSNWTLGNWSGSSDRKFRSLRAGMCMQTRGVRKFLIYGYFSSMTPTAMARVFQAYNCDYAMHLDMNALEHTYMSLYPQDKKQEQVPQYLVRGMKVLDERFKGNVPRYVGYPDNRDFFYFIRK